MNNKELEKLLYQEKKFIDLEINTYNKKQKNYISLYPRRRRLITIALAIMLIASSVVYAGSKMGVLEWFMKESNSYLDILETYPEYKVDIKLEDKEIAINVFGFVTDEENIYLYLEVTPDNLYVDEIEIINMNELYLASIQNTDYDFFYMNGMSSLTGGQQVYRLKAFDIDTGSAKFLISSLQDYDGNSFSVDMEFDLQFIKAIGKTVNINSTKDIKLLKSDETVTITVESVKFLPTATYLIYDMSHSEKVYVKLGDVNINNYKLESFFLSGDENRALYYPMPAQEISVFKWLINSYTIEDYDIKIFELNEFPSELLYKDHILKVEKSINDGYLSYVITDTGFAERDFLYMDMDIYLDDIYMTDGSSRDAYYIQDDGSVKELENIVELLESNIEKIKTKTYVLKSHETYKELKNNANIDFENNPVKLRINHLVRAYNVDEEITFYRNKFNMFKQIFSN